MTKKLDNTLETKEIKQTRNKRDVIPFRDSAISRINRSNTEFYSKRFKEYKFDVPKGSSLKGLMLRFSFNTETKSFVVGYWFNKRNQYYTIGKVDRKKCNRRN